MYNTERSDGAEYKSTNATDLTFSRPSTIISLYKSVSLLHEKGLCLSLEKLPDMLNIQTEGARSRSHHSCTKEVCMLRNNNKKKKPFLVPNLNMNTVFFFPSPWFLVCSRIKAQWPLLEQETVVCVMSAEQSNPTVCNRSSEEPTFLHVITELLRLEGTSGGHVVKKPAQAGKLSAKYFLTPSY